MKSKTPEKESVDVVELLKILLKNWVVILPCVFVAACVGVFLSMWARPVYQVSALVQVESKSGGASAMMGDLGSFFSAASPAETEIELIRSRRVMGPTVEKKRLNYKVIPLNRLSRLLHKEGRLELSQLEIPWESLPKKERGKAWFVTMKDSLGSFDLYDHHKKLVLSGSGDETYRFPYAGDSVTFGIFRADVKAGHRFAVYKLSKLDAIAEFSRSLDVHELGRKTGVIEFTYQDVYVDRAAEVLNEIVASYLRQNVEERNAEAQQTLNFLERQLPDVKKQMDSTMLKLSVYRNQVGAVDISTETRLVLQNRVELQQEILQVQQKIQEAERLFHSEHPTVKTLQKQESVLKKRLAETGGQAKKLPEKQQEILKLSNEAHLSKTLYTTLLNNIQRLKLVAAGEVGSVRIVDYAEISDAPVKPKKKVIWGISIFFGFLLGIGLALLRGMFSSGVKSANFIEQQTGFTVYAKVPKGNPKGSKGTRPLAVVEPDDVAVESLRALRSSLEFSIMEDGASVIGVSGLIPGVGKSFISVNLAALFAGMGKKVLLVDADLRKGRLHKEFGLKRGDGFSQVLLKKIDAESVIFKTEVENLDVIPCGNVPANPAELLSSRRYQELVDQFKTQYDLIIVDTPPIMLVTDAALACRAAGQIVMVIEYNKHSIEAIKDGMSQILKGNGNAHASIVINKYEHRRSDGFGYKYGKY